jgi:hypothetical protein
MKNALLFLLFCLLPLEVFGRQEASSGQTVLVFTHVTVIELVFTHVTVIDATGAPAQTDMTVVIRDDRIEEMGKTGELTIPEKAQVVDATGKFLIPGLWDMHASPRLGKQYLALFTANGVTGLRVTGGEPEYHEWRKEISGGKLIGPRMVIASPVLDGPNTVRNEFVIVSSEEEGRRLVRKFKSEGADFIKVYSYLTRDVYFAIADEANKQGIPFAGHLPYPVGADEISNAGQNTIEHSSTILIVCSSVAKHIKKNQMENLGLKEGPNLITDTYSEQRALEIFACFVKNSTWVCPMLINNVGRMLQDEKSSANDPRLKYIPSLTLDSWRSVTDAYNARSAEFRADFRRYCQKQIEFVGVMAHAGVGLLAGTDTPLYYCIPGFSLHDELALLVRAGLSPMQALQTATYNAANSLGLLDSMGTIEQGKTADLVLLDANPLRNIMNTQKIAAVVVGGKFFDKTKLQNMLAQVEGQVAIHQAVVDGDVEQVKLIISKGPDLNAGNESGKIPLNLAAREGHKEIVELLLEHGADVNVGNAINKRIAAEFAMDNNHTEVAQLLISKGSDISPLHLAIYMEDEIKAKSLIEGGADVNSRTPGGITPLNQAVGKGLKNIVELLIAYDADVNAGHYWGWTPLHSAAENGYEDIAEPLINAGANVKAKDGAGRTPLWYAKEAGHT